MENNLDNFDDLFRQRMSDFEPNGAKPDWGAFEQHWAENEEAENADFDHLVRERLRNVDDSARRAQHWKLMEEKLNKEFTLRGKLMRYRVLEAAVVALLVLTISNVLDNRNDYQLVTPDNKNGQIANQYKYLPQKTISNTPLSQKKSILKQYNNNITTIKQALNFNPLNQPLGVGNSSKADLIQQITLSNNNTVFVNSQNGTTFEKINTLNNNKQISNITAITKKEFINIAENISHINNNIALTEGGEIVETNRSTAIVEPLMPKESEKLLLDLTNMLPKTLIIKPLEHIVSKKSLLSSSMYASAMLDNSRNTVNSPVFFGESFDVQANSGGGINVAFKVDDNLEIETGLAYASKKYTPVQVRKITGNFDNYVTTNIRNVQLNLVNIPLHLKYQVKKGKRWNIFGILGGSLNLAAQTSYDTELAMSTSNQARKSLLEANGDRLPQSYQNGLLEGGRFNENYYVTADAGVSIEYKLDKRWSLFAQPTYMHHIGVKGIGPNKDRFNTLALHVGSKVTL